MLVRRSLLLVPALTLLLVGCSGEIDGPGNETAGGADAGTNLGVDARDNSADQYNAARQACVDRINAFRATEGKPPYVRWTEQEACADAQAKADGDASDAHGNFGMCEERAQNTCPGWPSIDNVIQGCLQAMWDEGPGEPFSEHGHYINMSSGQYTKVACGFYELPGGGIWASQNFR